MLIEEGADVNLNLCGRQCDTLLHRIVEEEVSNDEEDDSSSRILRYLLMWGASVDVENKGVNDTSGMTPFCIACQNNNVSWCIILAEFGADICKKVKVQGENRLPEDLARERDPFFAW